MTRNSLNIALVAILSAVVPVSQAADQKTSLPNQQYAAQAYGRLPLSFTANKGQYAPGIAFETRGSAYSISLARHEAIFSMVRPTKGKSHAGSLSSRQVDGNSIDTTADIRMQFSGASDDVAISGADELPGTANFLIGNDPAKWHTGVPTYTKVRYAGLYPGIDLVYYGNQRQLEFDFVLQPGADSSSVKLRFTSDVAGKQVSPRIDQVGDLVIGEVGKEIKFPKPVVYQSASGESEPSGRHLIDAGYVLSMRNEVSFRLGAYDKTKPLVIDPTLAYSTFLGGENTDFANGIAIDSAGNAYITGVTSSEHFPVTTNAIQKSENEGNNSSAFVTKFNSTGTALVYSTYLGGSDGFGDEGLAISVNSTGNAFVYGTTYASDFPTTPGAVQADGGAISNGVFVSKLNSTGSGFIYSTLVPGALPNYPQFGFAVDNAGSAYVTGTATSLPATPGAYQTVYPGNPTAFITKLNPTGSAIVYASYLGNGSTWGETVAVDKFGAAYVSGITYSGNFPTTAGALSTTQSTDYQGFLTKFDPTGSTLIYSTLLPGEANLYAIAVDGSGSAYLTGNTSGLTTTTGAFQPTYAGGHNEAFVTKVNPTGSALMYSTYLGGTGGDEGFGIAVDAQGNAYVAGGTGSSDFPITIGALQPAFGGINDVFLSKLNSTGSALIYSTYLGGSNADTAFGIAIDGLGNAYIAGSTETTVYNSASLFPTTAGAFQTAPPAGNFLAAFVAKFAPTPTGTTTQSITFSSLANEVYGAASLTLNASSSSGLSVIYGATGPVSIQGNKLTILGAGAVSVTAYQQGDTTYAPATPVTRNFLVLPAVLTATASSTQRTFGTANPIFTYTVTGFVNGENNSVVGGTTSLSTTATTTSPVGKYPITFAYKNLSATNYTFNYVAGTLTVTAATDTTAPTVGLTGAVVGPPKQEIFTSQDNKGGSGLASVFVNKCTNCTASTTPFTKGTTSAVTTTATKINQSLSSSVTIVATDVDGNSTTFDPVDLQLESKGRPTMHLVNIDSKENVVLISNGKPGMSWMKFAVNGHPLPLVKLSKGENLSLDIERYLQRGRRNEVLILADGKDDATSWIIFTEP
jgi:hypothetical protein